MSRKASFLWGLPIRQPEALACGSGFSREALGEDLFAAEAAPTLGRIAP